MREVMRETWKAMLERISLSAAGAAAQQTKKKEKRSRFTQGIVERKGGRARTGFGSKVTHDHAIGGTLSKSIAQKTVCRGVIKDGVACSA